MKIQTVRISKEIPKKQADEIIKKMGLKLNVKPNPQYKNFHSYRQIQPDKFRKDTFITKIITNKPKIFYIMGLLK